MNLCVVSPFPPNIQGVGEYGFHLVRYLLATGAVDRVVVLAERAGGARLSDDGRLRIEPAWSRDDPRSIVGLLARLARARPDAVWFNLGLTMFGTAAPALAAGLLLPGIASRLGSHAVVTLHELPDISDLQTIGLSANLATRLAAGAAVRVLLGAPWLIVTLRRYQQLLARQYGATNVVHVPLGSYAEPEISREPADQRILMFASFAPHKNLPMLLNAFQLLRRDRPALQLTVAGADHPRFPGYLASVRRAFGALPGISWLGAVEHAALPGLFRRCTVVALPYRATTGSSSVLHYACTYGRSAVVSDLPDFQALAEEEQLSVEFCPPDSAPGLAAALARLLDDGARRRAMADQNHVAMRARPLSAVGAVYAQLFRQRTGSAVVPRPAVGPQPRAERGA